MYKNVAGEPGNFLSFSMLKIILMITEWFLTSLIELDVIEFDAKSVVFLKLSICSGNL